MADIKSAYEIALEKISKIENATPEERLKWKFVPQGEQLATKYLKGDLNLLLELNKYKENERKFVTQGIAEVMVRNIDLPRNDAIKKTNLKVMDGIKLLKKDKAGVENIYSKIRYIFNNFTDQGEKQKEQAYEQVKIQFAAKLQQALQKKMGSNTMVNMDNIDIESQPQFQEEWRRVIMQLEAQYMEHLNEYRRNLIDIP